MLQARGKRQQREKEKHYQDGEKGVDVAPNGAENPLLLDRRDEDAREDAKGEDQIAQRHAKHQSAIENQTESAKMPPSLTKSLKRPQLHPAILFFSSTMSSILGKNNRPAKVEHKRKGLYKYKIIAHLDVLLGPTSVMPSNRPAPTAR